jgi:hypothetical protein
VAIIREVRPQVMVTYDEFGGYGHPDHIQAHRVATYAAALAAAPSYRPDLGNEWVIDKTYWTAFPRSVIAAGIEAMRESGPPTTSPRWTSTAPFACDDELITAEIDAADHLNRRWLRCVRTLPRSMSRAHSSPFPTTSAPSDGRRVPDWSQAMGHPTRRREDDLSAGIAE